MYGISRTIEARFEEALPRVREALKGEGFGVLTEIDVKETMKKKLDVDYRRYIILGACNPPLAHQALSAEPDIGLLLPCNVIVYENDEKSVTVAAIDAEKMFSVVDRADLESVARQVNAKLKAVIEKI
jgi:uncharacterized protein (DUF302 family)